MRLQRTFAAVFPSLRKIRTAKSVESFCSAATELTHFADFPQKDFIQILQSLSLQYTTAGFEHKELTSHLTEIMRKKTDLTAFSQICALESLMEIAPKGKTAEYKALLKPVLAGLYASRLDELSPESMEKLLKIVTNLRIRDTQLFDYVKSAIITAAFPQGVLTASLLGTVLKASAELNVDLGSLRSLIVESVVFRGGQFASAQIAHIANYLSRMEVFDDKLWIGCLIPSILRENVRKVSKIAIIQLHYTHLAIDFFAGAQLLTDIYTNFPEFTAFKREVIEAFSVTKQGIAEKPLSSFHSDVVKTCEKLNFRYKIEHTTAAPTLLTVDLLMHTGEVIEVQGPFHYLEDSKELTGKTVFKNRLLRKIGFKVVEIPYFLWGVMDESKKMEFLRGKIGTGNPFPSVK